MGLENKDLNNIPENQESNSVDGHVSAVKKNIDFTLSNLDSAYNLLKDVESNIKGYSFRQDTLEAVFKKYPSMTIIEFENYFLSDTYNKNILSNNPEILDLIDFEKVKPGSDLIEIVIDQIIMQEDDFNGKVNGAFDKVTVPNMVEMDTAQGYFKKKLEQVLPETEVIFGDDKKIKDNVGYNQLSADSVGFIDLLGNGLLNSCLFKLFKTEPDKTKLKEINEIFSMFKKDVFIGGSTYIIPFKTPENLEVVKMPKVPTTDKKIIFRNNGILLNSMGYLNSAYYADKVKASFVLGSHNIAEPMHAGKLTVINNDLENRHNHNWLISYFGEKMGLLMYTDEDNDGELQDFLSISREEVDKRNADFNNLYNEKIIPLVYGIFYRYLSKTFPNIIKAI